MSNVAFPAGYIGLERRSALVVVALLLASLAPAGAADNLATLKNGAAVVYSSPLQNGATANSILNTKRHQKLRFAKGSGSKSVFAVDLGKSYKVATISLKLPKGTAINVFVVPTAPPAGSSWAQMIAGMSPAGVLNGGAPVTLSGLDGEYVVFDFGTYKGEFADLVVTGDPVIPVAPAVVNDVVGLQGIPGVNGTPLGIVPITSGQFPQVPPASP